MKKLKYIILTLLLIIPVNIKAAVISCSTPGTVESGETFAVEFSGSLSSAASLWIASVGADGNVSYSSGERKIVQESSSMYNKVYYTAGDPGSASFYVYDVDVSDGVNSYSSGDTAGCSVTIVSATAPNGSGSSDYDDDNNEDDQDKSSNSYLKSLVIEGVKFSPVFNKDKMEYTAVVSGDKEKINVTGELEDDKATVEGFGEKELKEGINKIEIVVTAENGTTRTYTISVTRKEKNPIEVTINKKKYTVAKKDIGLKAPDGFTKTTVVIDKQEVVAYSNSFTGYIIVALVDEEGNASWYIYNQKNSTYTKYSEFKSNGLRLVIIEAKKKDIPYKYKKCKVEINGETVDAYALQLGSPYRVVYALNMDTGEKNFYMYDMEENTFQRFYNTQVEIYRGLLKKFEIGIIGLISVIAIMFFIIISQVVINKKTKKFIKNGGKEEKEKPIIDDDDETEESKKDKKIDKKVEKENQKTKTIKMDKVKEDINKTQKDDIDDDKPLTRSEMRKRKKEEKKRLEEERKEFFDL